MTHVSSTTAATPNNNTSTSLAVPNPASVVTGHLLIVDIVVRGADTTTNDNPITGPATQTWTKIGEWFEAGTDPPRLESWFRQVQGGDATTRSWTWGDASNAVAVISAHSGLDATPVPVGESVFSGQATSATSRITGALTTSGLRILRSVFADRTGSTYSGTSDTQRGNIMLTSDLSIFVQETSAAVSAVTAATRSATASTTTSVAAMGFYALEAAATGDANATYGYDLVVGTGPVV